MRVHALHYRKNPDELPPAAEGLEGSFRLETCQRCLWMSSKPLASRDAKTGQEAYEWVLRIACGLESFVLGETEVFGQLKSAWTTFRFERPLEAKRLQQVMDWIFEDAKYVRTQYLQHNGGQTYGSIARQILRPVTNEQVVVVGAGAIAESIIPYFAHCSVSLINRGEQRLMELRKKLQAKGLSIESPPQHANLILFCVPYQESHRALMEELQPRKVLHLGYDRPGSENFLTLADMSELQKQQTEGRDQRLASAAKLCHERAKLRALGGSTSLAHGWEDLAQFA